MARRGNGPGRGDGWGGPAKGFEALPARPFTARDVDHSKIPRDGEGRLLPSAKTRDRRERAKALEDRLFNLAMEAEREETQVAAAVKLHAIYEGQPIARQINATVPRKVLEARSLSDEERRTLTDIVLRGALKPPEAKE